MKQRNHTWDCRQAQTVGSDRRQTVGGKWPRSLEEASSSASSSWLKPALTVSLIALFAGLGYSVLNNSALPVYFQFGLGIDTAILAAIMIPFFVSEAVFKGPLSVLTDRFGRKPLIVAGPAISIFTPLILTLIHYRHGALNLQALVAFGFLRLLDGIGAAALWPASIAYIGDQVPTKKRAAAMGWFNVTYISSLALGLLAGGFVNDTFGPILAGEISLRQTIKNGVRRIAKRVNDYRNSHSALFSHVQNHVRHSVSSVVGPASGTSASAIPAHLSGHPVHYFPSFYLASALFALAAMIAVIALKNRVPATTAQDLASDAAKSSPVTLKSFLQIARSVPEVLVVTFVTFFGIGCIVLLVKLFALDEFGLTETNYGLLVLPPAILIAAVAVPLGHLSDHWGPVRSIWLGFSVAALSLWAMILCYHSLDQHLRLASLVVSSTLLGLGFTIAFPAWLAFVTTLCGEERRGTIIGAVSTAEGIGVLLGAVVGTLLFGHASSDLHTAHVAPFVLCALMLTLSAAMSVILIRPRLVAVPAVSS